MSEDNRKSLTVKIKVDLLNRFNAAVKRKGLKNQYVVEQMIIDYLAKEEQGNA